MVCMSKITMNQDSLRFHISFCHTLTFKSVIKGTVCPKTLKFKENT
ncbi:hypothetical protein IGK47_003652 [Enterococcus sp. AZ007]